MAMDPASMTAGMQVDTMKEIATLGVGAEVSSKIQSAITEAQKDPSKSPDVWQIICETLVDRLFSAMFDTPNIATGIILEFSTKSQISVAQLAPTMLGNLGAPLAPVSPISPPGIVF